MLNKLLLSLLLQVSTTIKKHEPQEAQDALPKMFSEILKADGCAIYLQKEDRVDYFLSRQYPYFRIPYFADTWQEYGWNLPTTFAYIDHSEQTKPFSQESNFQRYLILPLLRENRVAGILLAGWNKVFPLDSISPEEKEIFLPISQLLAEVYCAYPIISHLRQREKDLSALYCKAEWDLENSRKQVSLELHDEVGQVLTSILLQLNILQKSDDLEYIKGRLGGLHHITLQTLEEVRRISQNLRPNLLEKLGLQAAIEAHIKDYIDTTGIQVEFRSHNLGERIPPDLETVVYRGVQESLTNIARHAKASKAIVSLTIKGENLFLQILDDGIGMKNSQSGGTGILGMKERVKMAKGKFWMTDNGEGLIVNILLPLA